MNLGKHFLMMALLGTAMLLTFDELSQGNAPRPSLYIAVFAVFLILSMIAEAGPGGERFAAAFGGLVFLATALAKASGILAAGRVITGNKSLGSETA